MHWHGCAQESTSDAAILDAGLPLEVAERNSYAKGGL
jgi:hypothetical protein